MKAIQQPLKQKQNTAVSGSKVKLVKLLALYCLPKKHKQGMEITLSSNSLKDQEEYCLSERSQNRKEVACHPDWPYLKSLQLYLKYYFVWCIFLKQEKKIGYLVVYKCYTKRWSYLCKFYLKLLSFHGLQFYASSVKASFQEIVRF